MSVDSSGSGEAVERNTRDVDLASGLAAAEQELQRSSTGSMESSTHTHSSEERDSALLGQRVEKELLWKSKATETASSSLAAAGPEELLRNPGVAAGVLDAAHGSRKEDLLSANNARVKAEDDLQDVRQVAREDSENDTLVAETLRLKGMLDMANNELKIFQAIQADDEETQPSEEGDGSGAGSTRRTPRHMHELEAALAAHRESQRDMNDQMTQLRLQLLDQTGQQAQIGDLHEELAQQALPAGGEANRMRLPALRQGQPRRADSLAIIEEEDEAMSNAGASDFSGNVSSRSSSKNSSDAGGEDADYSPGVEKSCRPQEFVHSFIPGVENEAIVPAGSVGKHGGRTATTPDLLGEICELRKALAGRDAEINIRSQQSAKASDKSKEDAEMIIQKLAEVASLRETILGQRETHLDQMENMRKVLASSQSDGHDKAVSYQALVADTKGRETKLEEASAEMNEELHRMHEAKRIGDLRLEDMKRELESTNRRYETKLADLGAKLGKHEPGGASAAASTSSSAPSELGAVREQLQAVVEDQNVMAHTLEWKEVLWKAKLEHLELENRQQASDLKHQHGEHVAQLQRKLNEQQAEFKQRELQWEQEKKELEERAAARPALSVAAIARGWLEQLRCPSRVHSLMSRDVAQQLGVAAGWQTSKSSSSGPDVVHCQEVCWQVLNSVHGTTALLCDSPDLKIQQASAQASATWGTQIVGSPVVSLLAAPASGAWLRRAILTHQTLANMEGAAGDVAGFAIHALGRLAFREGSHSSFESSVTVAHLPAEPRLGRKASVIVIVEPVVDARAGGRRSGGRSESGSFAHGDARQSTVSDDIAPSDSASNIATRYY